MHPFLSGFHPRRVSVGTWGSLYRVLAVVALSALVTPSEGQYIIRDLGKTEGNIVFSRMNNKGEAAGYYSNTLRAMLYLPQAAYGLSAGFNDLSVLPGAPTILRDINDQGFGVGSLRTPSVFFRFNQGTKEIIPSDANPTAINESGQIVGWDRQTGRGFLLSGSQYTTIQGSGTATAINDRGQVAVNSLVGGALPAGIYENGNITLLPSLPDFDRYLPQDINNAGDAVGYGSLTGVYVPHAMLWSGGAVYDLGTFGGVESSAVSISDTGGVLLNISNRDRTNRTVLWRAGKGTFLEDLLPGSSGWSSLNGHDMNDLDQIIGVGLLNGESHAFLLSPVIPDSPTVPEPGVLCLLSAAGVVGSLCYARRRKRHTTKKHPHSPA